MRVAALLVLLAGCTTTLGTTGLVMPDPDLVGTKLLRPEARGQSCRATVLGVPLRAGGPDVREALGEILALDDEGNLVRHAEVTYRRLLLGVYNRRCVEVRGDLCRMVSSVTLPMMGEHAHP